MNDSSTTPQMELAQDVCALPLARRLAALLNRDPASLREREPLPRGWHVMLFNVPTLQSQLRHDGAASLGVTLPDLGLPRLMLAGRQLRFDGDIPLGAQVRRETRQGGVQMKQGRSGRFALVKIEHLIFVQGTAQPAVVETQDYVLREAAAVTPAATTPPAPQAESGQAAPRPDAGMTITPNEAMLFRYSAITDNPHRIHYDQAYATQVEGYPALVVNGSIPAMFLLELFRTAVGREPAALTSRNVAPMFCGRPLQLRVQREHITDSTKESWRLWAEDDSGNTTFDARAE